MFIRRRRSSHVHEDDADARWLGPGARAVAVAVLVIAAAWHARALLVRPPTAQSLADACAAGDYDGVMRALRAGVCAAGDSDATGLGAPLLLACAQSDSSIVELLLRHGADPGCTTTAGYTPLMTAAVEGNTAIIELLLNAGADPNQPTRSRTTALSAAAGTGNEQAVAVLLAHGADPHAGARGGSKLFHDPPLMCAIRCESVAVVKQLIEAGTDVNGADDEGITPLRAATDAGRDDLVQLLLRHGARRAPVKLAQAASPAVRAS